MFNEHYIKRCSNFKYVHLYAFFIFIQAKLSASPFVQICNALYTVQQNKTKQNKTQTHKFYNCCQLFRTSSFSDFFMSTVCIFKRTTLSEYMSLPDV